MLFYKTYHAKLLSHVFTIKLLVRPGYFRPLPKLILLARTLLNFKLQNRVKNTKSLFGQPTTYTALLFIIAR